MFDFRDGDLDCSLFKFPGGNSESSVCNSLMYFACTFFLSRLAFLLLLKTGEDSLSKIWVNTGEESKFPPKIGESWSGFVTVWISVDNDAIECLVVGFMISVDFIVSIDLIVSDDLSRVDPDDDCVEEIESEKFKSSPEFTRFRLFSLLSYFSLKLSTSIHLFPTFAEFEEFFSLNLRCS